MRYNRWFTPWVLVIPALTWLLVFNLWPSINTVILSFTNARPIGGGHFVVAAFQQAQVAQHVDRQRMAVADLVPQLRQRIAEDADRRPRIAVVAVQRGQVEHAFGHADIVPILAAQP